MNLKYINKIRANISIHSSKKTTNILDGTYKSVYKGKSLNFENLREYVINDDIKDIDWKSSARSGNLLVKQYIAEKKHNIMLVMDTGKKMDADTDLYQSKKDVALFTAGTIGYLAIKNNDYIGMSYSYSDKVEYKQFKYNLYNLEEYLTDYEKASINNGKPLDDTLEYIFKKIAKKMIIFIITDIDGLNNISIKRLKELKQLHDVLIININDNYMFGDNIFDIENDNYIPNILLRDKKLNMIEKKIKEDLLNKNKNRLKKNNINMISISSIEEIPNKVIQLLEEHRYASTK